ncbi:MAG: LysR family transcriptional regulator [Myxococcota bacterium]
MDIDLNDVAVFAEVVGAGSFTAAAKTLGLPPSAVSRRVARLESKLGVKLLNRTTRSLGLTEPGRIYYERAGRLTHELEEAARALGDLQERPAGLIRVAAPPDDGGVIWALVSGFLQDYPAVDLEILHSVDYVDLVEAGIDIALRGGKLPDTTLFSAAKLFESRMLLVASPQYLARRGVPTTLAELADHDCIAMDNWAPNALRDAKGAARPVRVEARNRVRVNKLDTIRAAALDGLGIAPLIAFNCWRSLQSGELVEVLPGTFSGPAPFWAVYPAGRKASAAARALVEHLIRTAPSLNPPSGYDAPPS